MSNIYEVFNVTNDHELSKVFDRLELSYNEMTNIDYIVESMNKENARTKILELMAGSADGNYEICLEQFGKSVKKRVLKEESGLNLNQVMELNQLVELVAAKMAANQEQCLEGIYNIISQKAGVNAAKTFIGMVQQSSVNQSSLKFNTDLVVDGKNLAQTIYALKNEIEIFCNSVKKEESEKEEVKESVNDYSMENHLAGVYNVKNGSFREGQHNLSEEDFRNRLVRYNFQDADNGKVCYITAWSYADAFNTRGALKKKYPTENVEKWKLEWFQNGDGSWNKPLKKYTEIVGKDGQRLNESYNKYQEIVQELDRAVDDVADINVLKGIADKVNELMGRVKNMNEANELATLKTTIETKINSLIGGEPLKESCVATQVAANACGEDTFNGLLDGIKPTLISITVNKEGDLVSCEDNCCAEPFCDCNDNCANEVPCVQPLTLSPTAVDAPILRKPNSAEVTSAITALASHQNDIKSDSRENNIENLQTINTLLNNISNYFNTLLGESVNLNETLYKSKYKRGDLLRNNETGNIFTIEKIAFNDSTREFIYELSKPYVLRDGVSSKMYFHGCESSIDKYFDLYEEEDWDGEDLDESLNEGTSFSSDSNGFKYQEGNILHPNEKATALHDKNLDFFIKYALRDNDTGEPSYILYWIDGVNGVDEHTVGPFCEEIIDTYFDKVADSKEPEWDGEDDEEELNEGVNPGDYRTWFAAPELTKDDHGYPIYGKLPTGRYLVRVFNIIINNEDDEDEEWDGNYVETIVDHEKGFDDFVDQINDDVSDEIGWSLSNYDFDIIKFLPEDRPDDLDDGTNDSEYWDGDEDEEINEALRIAGVQLNESEMSSKEFARKLYNSIEDDEDFIYVWKNIKGTEDGYDKALEYRCSEWAEDVLGGQMWILDDEDVGRSWVQIDDYTIDVDGIYDDWCDYVKNDPSSNDYLSTEDWDGEDDLEESAKSYAIQLNENSTEFMGMCIADDLRKKGIEINKNQDDESIIETIDEIMKEYNADSNEAITAYNNLTNTNFYDISKIWKNHNNKELDEETVYDHSWFEVEGQKYPKRTKNGVEGLPIKEGKMMDIKQQYIDGDILDDETDEELKNNTNISDWRKREKLINSWYKHRIAKIKDEYMKTKRTGKDWNDALNKLYYQLGSETEAEKIVNSWDKEADDELERIHNEYLENKLNVYQTMEDLYIFTNLNTNEINDTINKWNKEKEKADLNKDDEELNDIWDNDELDESIKDWFKKDNRKYRIMYGRNGGWISKDKKHIVGDLTDTLIVTGLKKAERLAKYFDNGEPRMFHPVEIKQTDKGWNFQYTQEYLDIIEKVKNGKMSEEEAKNYFEKVGLPESQYWYNLKLALPNKKKVNETCSAGACCAASVATVPTTSKKKSKPRKPETVDLSLFKESVRNDCPVSLSINGKQVSYKIVEGKGYLYIDNGIVKTLDKNVILETIDDIYNNCLDIDVLEGYSPYEMEILLEDDINPDLGDVNSTTTITPDEKKKQQQDLDNNLKKNPNTKVGVVTGQNDGEVKQNQEFVGIDDSDQNNKKYIVKDPATGEVKVVDYNQIKLTEI